MKDAGNNPVGGVNVTFTAPASGASASFSGSSTATVSTNAGGVATAPVLTGGKLAGSYTVTASIAGLSGSAGFSLTNTAPSAGGTGVLTGSGTSAAAAANLTAEGSSDWVHWGDSSLSRKTGVTPQIGNYTVVGSGAVLTYNNDPRALTWTDGAPTAAGNNTNGIYINSLQNGFAFTAPADTGTRTLTVHVGGWMSGGTLTAHLSDLSATDFVDSTIPAGGQYDRNYTLTYSAGSAAQTLTVSWVTTSGTGNVTLNGAALSGGTPAPAPIVAATAGTPQSATVGTAFTTALQATVTANSLPVSGATVTFTAPGSGAGATFGGLATATAITNASGVATAPALTANGLAGSYTVTASVPGVSATAGFSLTNTLPSVSGAGVLTGSGTSAAATANLTAEGSSDWVHWGDSSLTRKTGVTPQIGNYTVVGSGAVLTYNNDPRALTWTDGTPTSAGGTDTNGIYINSLQNGFAFTAPADTGTRTLTVHVGGWMSGGTLTAHLSDLSEADFVDSTTPAAGQYDRNYTLTYSAGSAGQTLTISWVATSGTGNVTLNGAALAGGAPAPAQIIAATAGTPQSATVGTAFATALQATVTSDSLPVSGTTVTFTAPASGAGATFGGLATATAITNASGVATAPALTANGQAGSYTITASAPGAGTPANFSLINLAGLAGILTGSGTSAAATASLTAEGGSDWVHWGDSSLTRKSGVTPQISNYTVVGSGTVFSYNNDPRALSWTDGTTHRRRNQFQRYLHQFSAKWFFIYRARRYGYKDPYCSRRRMDERGNADGSSFRSVRDGFCGQHNSRQRPVRPKLYPDLQCGLGGTDPDGQLGGKFRNGQRDAERGRARVGSARDHRRNSRNAAKRDSRYHVRNGSAGYRYFELASRKRSDGNVYRTRVGSRRGIRRSGNSDSHYECQRGSNRTRAYRECSGGFLHRDGQRARRLHPGKLQSD